MQKDELSHTNLVRNLLHLLGNHLTLCIKALNVYILQGGKHFRKNFYKSKHIYIQINSLQYYGVFKHRKLGKTYPLLRIRYMPSTMLGILNINLIFKC